MVSTVAAYILSPYCDAAVSPAYNLSLAVRLQRLRYLGHMLRLPHDSVVRRSLKGMTGGGKGAYSWTAGVQNWNISRPWQRTTLHDGTKWWHLWFRRYTVPLDPLGPLWTLELWPTVTPPTLLELCRSWSAVTPSAACSLGSKSTPVLCR